MQELELQLIEKCKKGDSFAFGQIYDLYIKKIYDFIFFKTHHKETAEDLASVTFTKAYENIHKISLDGSLSAWLFTIARNTVIDYYRTKKYHSNIEDAWDLSDDSFNIEEEIDCKNKINSVKEYLAKLTQEQREVVTMRVWQEMSYKEIAEALGKSEASCKMIFSRTIAKLKEQMPVAVLLAFLLRI